jgi:hypothetical protein
MNDWYDSLFIYTGHDLKWDTPLWGVFQIVSDIRPLTN